MTPRRNGAASTGRDDQRLRVLLMVSELEDFTIAFANGLAEHAEVLLAVPHRRYTRLAGAIDPRVDLRLLDWPRHRDLANPRFLMSLTRLVRRERPDVVHLLSHTVVWLNFALPFFRPAPIVITVHDVDLHPGDTDTNAVPRWCCDLAVRQSSDVVVHGEALARRAVRRFGKMPNRVHVLPHPAIGRYAQIARREAMTRRPSDNFTVLMFGRLFAYKGVDVLVRAEALLRERLPGLRIVLAGRGDDPWILRGSMGDPSRYDIRGRFVEDREVAQLFLDADIVALPYREASQSGVLNIAAAFGRPVVATDVGEMGATVRLNRLGAVVPPGDAERFADAIAILAERPGLRAKYGRSALRWAEGPNAPSSVGAAAAALYRTIAAREAARRTQRQRFENASAGLHGIWRAPKSGGAIMRNETAVSVRHYLAGGRESAGGIGRLVGYVIEAAPPGQAHCVADTRGPRWSPLRSLMRLALALAAMLRDRILSPQRIHHIHVAGRGSTSRKLILAKLAHLIGCTHVLHLHDNDYAADFVARPAWQRALVRQMFQRADRVIVLGRRDRETAVERLGVAPARVDVLCNCVPDPGPCRPPDAAVATILFLGTLGPRKGVPELLAALASPAMASLPWRAVLAGDGPVDDYRIAAEERGLACRVTMTGWLGRTEAGSLLADADILVLPSHAEGMAMAVIEGLAHGCAVVTTRVGAHEEAIEDGVNGLFVPVGDADALAAVLARLVADPAARTRLGAAARAGYLERFCMAAYMRGLGALYDTLVPVRSPFMERQTT